MYKLKLNGRTCVSCGICMDVCQPDAIVMRTNTPRRIEGNVLSYLQLCSDGNCELPPAEMMTFPYLADPQLCDGCALCVTECPVDALELKDENSTRIAS
jgi:ferredoxin